MHIDLDEGCLPDAAEAVNLPGLDDENVACTRFEFLSVDGPETAAFPHELDFVVRMTMGPRTTTRGALRRNTETLTSPLSAPTK